MTSFIHMYFIGIRESLKKHDKKYYLSWCRGSHASTVETYDIKRPKSREKNLDWWLFFSFILASNSPTAPQPENTMHLIFFFFFSLSYMIESFSYILHQIWSSGSSTLTDLKRLRWRGRSGYRCSSRYSE